MKTLTRPVTLLLLSTAVACQKPAAVHFLAAPGASASNFVMLRMQDPHPPLIRSLTVTRVNERYAGAPGEVMWSTTTIGGERAAPDSVRYGVAPAGFVAGRAVPLSPGRYEIEVVIGGHMTISYFTIANNGRASS
jgi:hypothetical protein